LRAAIHPPGPDRDNKLEYQHGFEWRQAARIAFVVIATAAVWSETWEPVRGIGLIGGIGLLVEGWPILTEAFDHLLARRMTMELSIVRRLHRGPLRMFLDPDARLRQS
jgi:Cd2+/Zn2+-exporting ATPase/Cu+-exporting ATPase